MFVLPGIVGLFLFLYVRPQEFVHALEGVPLLAALVALALAGWVLDLRLRLTRPLAAPQLLLVLVFACWCLITVAVSAPHGLQGSIIDVALPTLIFLLIGHGVSTFKGLAVLASGLLVIVLLLASIGIEQGLSEKTCHRVAMGATGKAFIADERPCEKKIDCPRSFEHDPGTEFVCEHGGLFGTSSVGGRVRYRGILMDPNELSLAVATGLPFAFAFFTRRRTTARAALLAVTLAAVGLCIVFTKSRGGQLVVMTVLSVYFSRRFGWRGLLLAAAVAAPIVLFGGRSGDEAEASSEERINAWYTGLELFRQSPVFGVGRGEFTEHHYLTAHNSYVLTLSELGAFGYVLWMAIFYLSLKIPIVVLGRVRDPVARIWAVALLASLAGLAIGIFFLSFAYHPVLWCFLGMSAALAAAVRRHEPGFRVGLGLADGAAILGGSVLVAVMVFAYTRLKV